MTDDRISQFVTEAKRMRYSRRGIAKRAAALGLGSSAIAAALTATGRTVGAKPNRAPAFLQERSLTILGSTYFVPAGEELYRAQAAEWGEQAGVNVTVDLVNWPDLQPRIAAAVEGGSGADIIEMWDTWPYLYYENMVPSDDLANTVSERYGGFFDWVVNTASVDGAWYSIPSGTSNIAVAYRLSYLEEAGIDDPKNNFPTTWEELFAVGKTLKEMGKPLGQALGHSTGDPPSFAYPYMWSYGAMEVEEDGTTVAINKPEFIEGMQIFMQAWVDAYDEAGLSWDDSTNNRAFLSDQISVTQNGSSVYLAAVDAAEGASTADYEIVVDPDDIWHAMIPGGPAGQFAQIGSRSYAAMSYSENADVAMEFLDWWFQEEQFINWVETNEGYFIPMAPGYSDLGVFTDNPTLAAFAKAADVGRHKGYAGPSNQNAAEAFARYTVIDMFAQAIQSGDAQGAIENAANILERVYGS